VVLLHGWTVTADLNWFTSYAPLGRHFRVLALDHRGHGRGIRSARPFRLEDCADDVAALAEVLAIDSFIPVGYSLGGPIAMLVAHRHRDRVDGLVLCATALDFAGTRQDRLGFLALGALALASRYTPDVARRWLSDQYHARRGRRFEQWALEQCQPNDPTALLEAGAAIGSFSAHGWIRSITVPAAVLITSGDRVVPVARQEALAAAVPNATRVLLEGEHDLCVVDPDQWIPALLGACEDVAARAAASRRGRAAGE
jgi:3-oxoadipate enol-lactonase